MAPFDRSVSIRASPEAAWRAVKSAASQQGEVTAEREGSLLVIRRTYDSLVYFLQAQERSRPVSLRHVVTAGIDAGSTLQSATDIAAALDPLPGGPRETGSWAEWPARRRLEAIISMEGRRNSL